MAKFILMIAVAIFLSVASLLGHTHATDALLVQGKVYCDTCRVGFETKLTQYLAGARVALECRRRETGELTFSEEGATDASGTYKMEVSGDHEEDICLVTPTKSPRPDCAEVATWEKARVLLTKNNGAITPVRYANSIGFTKKVAVDGCLDALRELGIVDLV